MMQKTYLRVNLFLWARKLFLLLFLLILCNALYAQERSINGVVTDENGTPVPGVNLIIKGTTAGTVTDINGKFALNITGNEIILVISYIGYETQEIQVGQQTSLNIVLKEKTTELDQVVVVGYGVQKKSDLTGAIASVKGDQLVKTPTIGVDQALQGRAAGVQVINASGMPGADVVVRVRGITSLNTRSDNKIEPLYIIDGVPGSISSVNPNDIESIEVLKDASSAAIYGTSGGNGVIIITSKKGTLNQKIKTTFSMYRGIQSNDVPIKVTNTREYVDIMNKYLNKPGFNITANPDTLPYTDWWKATTKNATMEEYNLSINGGNAASTLLVSLGYLNQQGIVDKTDYSRFTCRINSDTKLTKRIKFGENLSLLGHKNRGAYDNATYNSFINDILKAPPISNIGNASAGWQVPMYGDLYQPVAEIYYSNDQKYGYRADGNLFANIDFFKGFSYNTKFGGYVNIEGEDIFEPAFNLSPNQSRTNTDVQRRLDLFYFWNWQHVLNYKITVANDHNLEFMSGFESQEKSQNTMWAQADSIINNGEQPELRYFDAAILPTAKKRPSGNAQRETKYSYFGRFNYDYKGIFMGTFNVRRDGSSTFGANYKFGTFPAFSLGFKFSELEMFKNLSFLSFGKIRYGWGKTGNDQIKADKVYSLINQNVQQLYNDNPGNGYIWGNPQKWIPGGYSLSPPNPNLHWEVITTNDLGLDLNFFKNRLSLVVDLFTKENSEMLQDLDVPYIAGGWSDPSLKPAVNLGGLSNKGIEVSIGYKDNSGDLKYSFDVNFTKVVSKVVDLGDTLYRNNVNGQFASITRQGEAPGLFIGYKTNGIFRESDADTVTDPNGKKRYVVDNQPYKTNKSGMKLFMQNQALPGDIRFVDVNNDTAITDKDITIIGDPNPKFTYGFSGSLSYKGFDMNFTFQGSYGNSILNAAKISLYGFDEGKFNFNKDVLNSYRSPVRDNTGNIIDPGNTTTNLFRIGKQKNDNYRTSDWYVEDGSYFRLKSVQLGYTIPKSLSSKFGVEYLRIYIGAKNLLTFTKYTGMDPEVGAFDPTQSGIDWGVYPQAKMYLAGLEITF